MERMKLWYLSLVIGAYMVGLGNVWRFPVLAMKYGLGGILLYLVAVFLMVGIVSTAMESTKKRRYEVVEYYLREHGKPAFGVLFLLFDLLFIGYYSILGGWTVTSTFVRGAYDSPVWSMVSLLVFILVMVLILLQGRERTFDTMVFSLVALFLSISALLFIINSTSKTSVPAYVVESLLVWRGITPIMVKDMAEQAVYSLGVGLGFFLVMGSYLPDDVPTPLLALGGALVDTLASFLGTFLTGAVIGLNSPAAMDGDSILFTVLPETLGEIPHGTVLRYLFAFALFLAAITSMIPLGETVARIYSEVSWVKRSDAVVKTMLGAFFVGVFAVLGMERGFDTVGLLDSTVATFALIGGVVSAWAALTGKNYIPPYLRAWALLGALSLAVLGVFAVYNLFISGRYLPLLLLAMGVLLAMSLTSRVKERVEMGLRIPSRYR